MDSRDFEVLVSHHRIALPRAGREPLPLDKLATLAANLTHYGYALTHEGFEALRAAAEVDVEAWWLALEGALMTITGDDKNMAEHVVYKNFPAEVLAMDLADYWLRQILMYWGLPNAIFTQEEAPRAPLDEPLTLKVLQPAGPRALAEIYQSLLRRPARWSEGQRAQVELLAPRFHGVAPVSEVPFKENQVHLAALLLRLGHPVTLSTATDVLRLSVGMSGGDISLREASKLRTFTRPERKALLAMLESAAHLGEDVARRPERFKRLLRALRPGDYAARFPRVVAIYDTLYRGKRIDTPQSRLEKALAEKDPAALTLLSERPGEFRRRLFHCIELFGADASGAFARVIPKLTTIQLLEILRQLRTQPERVTRTFPPKGNWSKLQIRPQERGARLAPKVTDALCAELEREIASRVAKQVPSVRLDPRAEWIKLQSNDSDLTPYGRGTVFPIPADVSFIRTASYWESGPTSSNLWYDNGWNFFSADWKPMGACCWNVPKFGTPPRDGAVFSGDPTNTKDSKGRACQMIDLYLDRLAASRVRFAVWNVLCYSRRTFDEAKEVFAALQWGQDAQAGALFEPARCQLAFPLRGTSLTKYIAYVDVDERQLVYLDANLYGRVGSAAANQKVLSETMPAFIEYLSARPSVHDLFAHVPRADDGTCIAYDDADESLAGGPAYVFRPTNQANSFEPLDLARLLK